MMARLLVPMSMLSLLSTGAIFGFFYAWVCSTMWGLDAADPRIAISAMQAMNASVQNAVFFPAFFLTPVILVLSAGIAFGLEFKRAAALFLAGAGTYFVGSFLVTVIINVPMNTALAEVSVPTNQQAAREIWSGYSPTWQYWNTVRALFSGFSLLLTGLALLSVTLHKTQRHRHEQRCL